MEEDDEPEDMVAMIDRSQWTGPGISEPPMPPSLQQMFTLARRMGYEMCPIARRTETARQASGSPKNTGTGISHTISKVKLRSYGTYASSLPKAGLDTSIPTRWMERAV